jgi:hypothetical protein
MLRLFKNSLLRLFIAAILSGFVLPNVSLALSALRSEDPCGMVLCCCPQMCKMAKKRAAYCKVTGPVTCGIKVAAKSNAAIAPHSVEYARIALTGPPDSLLSNIQVTWLMESLVFFNSHTRSPLDKPPPFFF